MENSVSVNETAVMNSIKNGMKNLLFIEGNRSEIDKANVVESYNKIKAMGFIPTMPVEFLPIEQAQNKLGGRRLLKPVLKREKGEGIPTISNFKIEMETVPESEYHLYDGVCVDGQHRTVALMFPDMEAEPKFQKAWTCYNTLPCETMASRGKMMIFTIPKSQPMMSTQTIS